MTIPNLISRAELTDGRRSVGRGRVTKQASTVLALIEHQTASYIAHAAQTMNHLPADTKVGALPSNFLAALALSRSTHPPLTIEDLERNRIVDKESNEYEQPVNAVAALAATNWDRGVGGRADALLDPTCASGDLQCGL